MTRVPTSTWRRRLKYLKWVCRRIATLASSYQTET